MKNDGYEWEMIPTWGNPERLLRGSCLHENLEPVRTIDPLNPEIVAWLCLVCDRQIPAPGWDAEPVFLPGGHIYRPTPGRTYGPASVRSQVMYDFAVIWGYLKSSLPVIGFLCILIFSVFFVVEVLT